MNRRGLTLIEVVAATALLASLTVIAVSVIRDSRRVIEGATHPPDLIDLAVLADEIAVRPASFGLDPAAMEPRSVIVVPDDAGGATVEMALRAPDHAWLRVARDGLAVFRYVPLEGTEPP